MFRLGRAKTSNYVIREFDIGGRKWLNVMSKCQCTIVRNIIRVFLRDKSFNSIWENCIKLGKDNIWSLKHTSEIFLAC